ncbi:glycosyl hydrolase family 26 [Christiangramia fulva]|uniref:Glycosyl hydrolase family 26 n=1 Tax=Christiangramia fulva TaxID=2126553 RepID=A0A2R3Z2V3_9FLAO|nr:glycosyl hydrolase [Christiangramia fulva]AVR44591.1 glycosyl hydrolase family 26 [Christiangramia fulva]
MKKLIITLGILFSTICCFAQKPVNPNASEEARDLLNYIYSLDGKILSGQHSYNESPDEFYDLAYNITGKYPSILGTDFYWNGKTDPGPRTVQAAIENHKKGAIITLMWHVGRPGDDPPYGWSTSVQNEFNDKKWQELMEPGTKIHIKWLEQVDNLASHLIELQKAGVPVLWRPYHEMNGVWFWWGNNPEGYKKLWKMLYDRLTNYHKLNNLIWVWNANAPRDIPFDEAYDYLDFYPGADYVDVLATDVYHYDYEQKDYESLLELADGKPIALGEVGELPKTNILEKQPKWSWFMVWSNWLTTANSKERVKEIYNFSKTINRDGIKN